MSAGPAEHCRGAEDPGRIRPASRLFVAPELLFLHHMFWLGQHVYTGTCLHANDTQTAGSLTAVSAIFNFSFYFTGWRLHKNGVFQVDC